jgi:transcription initiation factor TFIIE subunit beta
MNLTATTKQLQLQALDRADKYKASQKGQKSTRSQNGASAPSSSSTTTITTTSTTTTHKSTPKSQTRAEATQKNFSVQHMSAQRAKPNPRVMYDVIKYLMEVEKPAQADEIHASTGHDIKGNPNMMEALQSNPKIHYEDGWFSFKPLYPVKNLHELLELINNNPNGIDVADLKDSYKTVEQDIKKLLEQREIISIRNDDAKTDIVYPNDPRYRIAVSDEHKMIWRSIKIPDEVELEREMKAAGLTVVEEVADKKPIKRQSSKQKKERKRKITKITNTHILASGIDLTKDFVPGQQ